MKDTLLNFDKSLHEKVNILNVTRKFIYEKRFNRRIYINTIKLKGIFCKEKNNQTLS